MSDTYAPRPTRRRAPGGRRPHKLQHREPAIYSALATLTPREYALARAIAACAKRAGARIVVPAK